MTGGRFGVPRMMHGDSPLVYVSGIQLFISFNLHTGFTGPWCYKKRWYSQEDGQSELSRNGHMGHLLQAEMAGPYGRPR